ncbi:hypothetical protein CCAX7_43740 [Capsulimonas corticalis]|uniref:Uncharacterized protein n=1 Tax=Capsulimonas corticalis TaxID=2219043 RepID=A0A402CXC2_9BACT|nr:hypothetical protein [Capsulimonas corticalis]BDI32323.1 hypothetical protein CCAX7_43740 [Capsulimonas corticalis]
MTIPTTTTEAPNGPVQLLTDAKKEKFRLDYNGASIFQGSVKVRRADTALSLKDANTRLFVLSKYDGWDIVTQTIRVGVIGATDGDIVLLKGVLPETFGGMLCKAEHVALPPEPVEADASAFYCIDHDWMLSVDDGAEGSFLTATNGKTKMEFAGEIVLRFRPWYRARHCGV